MKIETPGYFMKPNDVKKFPKKNKCLFIMVDSVDGDKFFWNVARVACFDYSAIVSTNNEFVELGY